MLKEGKYIERKEKIGKYTKLKIKNVLTNFELEIIPEKGAKINGLSCNINGKYLQLIDGYETYEEVYENLYSKSSILAPFPNRIADGKYKHNGKEYVFPINMPKEGNAIHGFIENEKFEVVSSNENENGYEIVLRHKSKGNKKGYPFPFIMDVLYRLTDQALETEVNVINIGSEDMPFGYGWHPYFKIDGSLIDMLELQISDVEKIEVDYRLIPTGEKTRFDVFKEQKKINNEKFDTGFVFTGLSREVSLTDMRNNIQIIINMGNCEYVQIFTPPWRTSIAVEPMTCMTNAFNNKEGLVVLEPNRKITIKHSVSIKEIK